MIETKIIQFILHFTYLFGGCNIFVSMMPKKRRVCTSCTNFVSLNDFIVTMEVVRRKKEKIVKVISERNILNY